MVIPPLWVQRVLFQCSSSSSSSISLPQHGQKNIMLILGSSTAHPCSEIFWAKSERTLNPGLHHIAGFYKSVEFRSSKQLYKALVDRQVYLFTLGLCMSMHFIWFSLSSFPTSACPLPSALIQTYLTTLILGYTLLTKLIFRKPTLYNSFSQPPAPGYSQ